jgi:hypothetical protein
MAGACRPQRAPAVGLRTNHDATPMIHIFTFAAMIFNAVIASVTTDERA